ncbi:MAG: TspO/MBR family protein [bacterium]|nr:TspO/MBR family protein [bacterium]
MTLNIFFKLVIAISVSEAAGVISVFFTAPAVQSNWYLELVKPALNPPAWVFGPVWTTLFALMGIAAFLIWREHDKLTLSEVEGLAIQRKKQIKIALSIFLGQLVLNTLWSIIFFGLHSPGGALIEIVFLWFAILATIIVFYKISKPAAWLLVPYILWVSFATYLNYAIWMLN